MQLFCGLFTPYFFSNLLVYLFLLLSFYFELFLVVSNILLSNYDYVAVCVCFYIWWHSLPRTAICHQFPTCLCLFRITASIWNCDLGYCCFIFSLLLINVCFFLVSMFIFTGFQIVAFSSIVFSVVTLSSEPPVTSPSVDAFHVSLPHPSYLLPGWGSAIALRLCWPLELEDRNIEVLFTLSYSTPNQFSQANICSLLILLKEL